MDNFFEKNISEKFEIPKDIIQKIKKLKNLFEIFLELIYINRYYVDIEIIR